MHSTVRLPPAPALVAGRVRPRLCGPATYRSKASCRGLGQDAASGFLDVAKLVSGSTMSKKGPYDKVAARIGDVCYADMHGWKIYLRDMKAEVGGNVTMAQLLANQLGPMMSRDGVDEREVEDFMKKVPVSLGKKKTLALLDVVPSACIRDLMRELEDCAKDL